MAFMKHHYALTASKSKHVMSALEKRRDKFVPILCIFNLTEEIKISVEQYMSIFGNRDKIYHFFEMLETFELDFSDDDSHFIVRGINKGRPMLEMKQIIRKSNKMSSIFIISDTFDKLMALQNLLYHNMYILENNLKQIDEFYAKKKTDKKFDVVEYDKCHNGFDFALFAMELMHFEDGVVDYLS